MSEYDRSKLDSMGGTSVTIQTSPEPVPAVPVWFGEVAIVAHYLTRLGMLTTISDRVRFVRKRFGTFEVIDFVAVLMGYALSGEATLAAYYGVPTFFPFKIPAKRDALMEMEVRIHVIQANRLITPWSLPSKEVSSGRGSHSLSSKDSGFLQQR